MFGIMRIKQRRSFATAADMEKTAIKVVEFDDTHLW